MARVSLALERLVEKGTSRKYFRFRVTRFYGGSAAGDVVLCNLRCAFCWTGRPRDDPRLGFFVEASEAARRLLALARSSGARVLRLTAGEPTLGRRHLLALLGALEDRVYKEVFILETNGIMLALDKEFAESLASKRFVHVRISVKACSPSWFKVLTGASEEGLRLQLEAVRRMVEFGADVHVAVFAAFGSEECWARLLESLASIDPGLLETLEVEALVLYPAARRRLRLLRRFGINPRPGLVYEPGTH